MMHPASSPFLRSSLLTCLFVVPLLAGCARREAPFVVVSGALSAIYTIEELQSRTAGAQERPGALLGIYVSEFLARGTSLVVESALAGVEADVRMTAPPEIQDADFALLRAFGDALQVDVPELLNRSPSREQSLNAYVEALRNVGQRANERFEEVEEALGNTRTQRREKQQEVNVARRQLQQAIREEDFAEAGERQQTVNELEAELADIDLRQRQTENIHRTYRSLLDVYRRRILAIESNREALITGVRVVDVPSAENLDVLLRPTREQQRSGLQLIDPGTLFNGLR